MSSRRSRAGRKPAGKAAVKKPFPWKKALLLLLSLAFFFSAYQIALMYYQGWILHVYCISAGLLAVLYLVLNRGMLSVPDAASLPDEWDAAQKKAFLHDVRERRRRSSVILYFLIPLILTVLYDMIYLFLTLNMGLSI